MKNWEWAKIEMVAYNIGNEFNQILQNEILQEGRYPIVSQSMNRVEGYCNEESKPFKVESLPIIVFGATVKHLNLLTLL